MSHTSQATSLRTAIANTLLASVIAIVLRIALTLGDGAVLCSSGTPASKAVTLIADFVSIVVIAACMRLVDKQRGRYVGLVTWGLPCLAFVAYELIRNPCLLRWP
jgi:hypothetical protein